MGKLTQRIRFAQWNLSGYLSPTYSLDDAQKVTVLIAYHAPERMIHINSQIRNILKCTFVERVIVSNHNPEVNIEKMIGIKTKRLVCINQNVRRRCGYRWRIANGLDANYLIVIDDDVLLFPGQLKRLCQHLIQEPEFPHGISGMVHMQSGELHFREQENIDVHYLCEVYAVTKDHVERFFEIERLLVEQDETTHESIEQHADFLVISRTGSRNPKIHKVGRLFRSDTFKTPGVAVHKDEHFAESRDRVFRALKEIQSQKQT
jgi:hypothetical protein